MDEFYILIAFIITTSASALYLLHRLDTTTGWRRYNKLQYQLESLKLVPPEAFAPDQDWDMWEHECTHLQNEMRAIRKTYRLKTEESFKPF